ncbi:3',5'-cyclic-nucleotide phosphodiesterase [Aquabacterium sp. A7-Y]|uniref:MBL fold metallo-hydrolase n=1 Tax=Aquabacterium sp. A7-Y TaxID=1349605 RepID=UPI00223E197F|nr:3',5'-cyclic-nucleotide phosphodiesterase [Aquabacterium sp. A7-Y]MCW7538970.1 3',5'-cyclic-nucleotide phosphodiesterase [Aquabacterium sp. A7-Y]
MKVRVLGCSGAIAAGCRTTSFLLDDDLLVDAGTGVGDLTLDELACIDHIVVSHSHLDHIVSIPLLADAVMKRRSAPITVYALQQTLDALRKHVLNGVIWPDFTRLPSVEHPALKFEAVSVGQQLEIAGKRVEVLPAEHTVPAVGYAVQGSAGWWVYTGDTGPNPALWPLLATRPVAMLVIETAFSDSEQELARISKHLSPSTLESELAGLRQDVPVYITHTKPGEMDCISEQTRALASGHQATHLEAGQHYEV